MSNRPTKIVFASFILTRLLCVSPLLDGWPSLARPFFFIKHVLASRSMQRRTARDTEETRLLNFNVRGSGDSAYACLHGEADGPFGVGSQLCHSHSRSERPSKLSQNRLRMLPQDPSPSSGASLHFPVDGRKTVDQQRPRWLGGPTSVDEGRTMSIAGTQPLVLDDSRCVTVARPLIEGEARLRPFVGADWPERRSTLLVSLRVRIRVDRSPCPGNVMTGPRGLDCRGWAGRFLAASHGRSGTLPEARRHCSVVAWCQQGRPARLLTLHLDVPGPVNEARGYTWTSLRSKRFPVSGRTLIGLRWQGRKPTGEQQQNRAWK